MILKRLPGLAALALSLSLVGCGELTKEDPNLTLVRQMLPQVLGRQGGAAETAPAGGAGPGLSAAAIDQNPVPLMLASVVGSGTATLLQQVGDNSGKTTFASADGTSATFQDGLLIATRGLGADLMAADVAAVRGALRAGGGLAVRVHEYLGGLDQILRREYTCRVAPVGPAAIEIRQRRYDTMRFDETCAAGDVQFTNTYWIDRDHVIRKSRQLISPPLGYLDSERL